MTTRKNSNAAEQANDASKGSSVTPVAPGLDTGKEPNTSEMSLGIIVEKSALEKAQAMAVNEVKARKEKEAILEKAKGDHKFKEALLARARQDRDSFEEGEIEGSSEGEIVVWFIRLMSLILLFRFLEFSCP